MRIYQQKQQQSQQGKSGDLARPRAAAPSHKAHPILHLQNTIGNQEAQRLLRAEPEGFEADYDSTATARFAYDFAQIPVYAKAPVEIQSKLTVNTPGDIYEQEADRFADQIMRMPEVELRRKCACGGGCPECQSQTEQLSRKTEQLQVKRIQENDRGGNVTPPIVNEVLHSSGQPLDAQTRDFMESRFGYDFSRVRVHTDDQAVKSAQAVNARAYTVGQNIAFGERQYSPQTLEGRRLLAHELTHVVHQTGGSPQGVPMLQRQDEGAAEPAKNYPYLVTFKGCDELPHKKDYIEGAVKRAFEQARDSDCIKSESLKEDILAKYNGLNIVCQPDNVQGTCAEAKKSSQAINIYTTQYKSSGCPGLLEAVIFHESVHLAEWNLFHGDLPFDCQASCFPGVDPRGDASKCTYERSFLPFVGISAGRVSPAGKGSSTGYLRLYVGVEKRGPILSVIHPSLGIGMSFIGETTTGEPRNIPSGSSTLVSLIGALRFDPGKVGGGYFSVFGGPEFAPGSEKVSVGYEVGAALGFRWHVFDVSLDAGIGYDPTRKAGMEKMYTLGATLKIAPKVRR